VLQSDIGKAELDILNYITEHHPATVRQVADHLAATKGHTRTTALNMMERLRRKGYLNRRKIDGIYHYSPSLSRPRLMQGLVRDFVQHALGGSVSPFVAYLAQAPELTDAELAELKAIVRELDAQREGTREAGEGVS
jgi:predicted transcriptional regulator